MEKLQRRSNWAFSSPVMDPFKPWEKPGEGARCLPSPLMKALATG